MDLCGASWQHSAVEWDPFGEDYIYAPGEAHVFLAQVPDNSHEMEGWLPFLLGEEGLADSSIDNGRLFRQRVLSQAMRYLVCAACLKVAPDALRFGKTPAGKPVALVGEEAFPHYFTQSHTDGYVLTAVCDMPCGVDVERLRSPARYPRVVGTGLPTKWVCELSMTKNAEEASRLFTFYWTALESLFKMDCGHSLMDFLRGLKSRGDTTVEDKQFDCSWGVSFAVDDNHVACLTLASKPSKVRGFHVSMPGAASR